MNNPEIFTSEEQNENEERKRELIELVASGEATLIVGAGSSARVGYVTWNGLLEKLEDLANRCGSGLNQTRKDNPLEYAEDIKSHIEKTADIGKYYDLLDQLFKPKSPAYDEFHSLLIDLPFRGILTTNYDTVLEAALLAKKIEAEREGWQIRPIDVMPLVIGPDTPRLIHEFLLARSNDPHIPQRIAHLHGLHRYRESIILSSEDYVENYGLRVKKNGDDQGNEDRWTFHRKLLWAVLATRRVVFVGFSMEDPYFEKMLEIVSTDLWGWNKSIHFAIMGISAEDKEDIQDSKGKAERLKSKYGIDTVFYEVVEKSHKRLEDIFADIKKQYENRSQSDEEIQDPSSDSDSSENQESKPTSSGSRDILNWLKQAGQRMIRRIGDED
ncbi:hypothetical protein F4009_21755 [Candidatus Poribacteria bacterium]|nr:hypothetical protein [Candidatus Poribacteria bacterium]MYH81967.1 hypothetical protein [Candidatus Poribacteria bacterium]MYK96585.1 hypothetical protein [Candidatus Poribacteria bacterium]